MEEMVYPVKEVRPFQVCCFSQGFYIQTQRVSLRGLLHFNQSRDTANWKVQNPDLPLSCSVSGNTESLSQRAKITGMDPLEYKICPIGVTHTCYAATQTA